MKDKQETRIKRAHVTLMKYADTALYSGVMLMGESSVTDGKYTAYTDGENKRYGRAFIEGIARESQLRGLVLHENLHIVLKHPLHGMKMYKENPKLANISADFVVNGIIKGITTKITGTQELLVELPDGGCYDPMFNDWSMKEVYDFLKKKCKGGKGGGGDKGKGGGQPDQGEGNGDSEPPEGEVVVTHNGKDYKDSMDEHDFDGAKELTHEQAKEINDKIDRAIREGGILAGRMGAKIPRSIQDLLEPRVSWREEVPNFVFSSLKGNDDYSWRRMNKRQLVNDIYLPTMISETVGELIIGIDTSGSIGDAQLTEFATELVSICHLCQPETVRVLWWDTAVHGEQVFTESDYGNIAGLLKPLGGGGTTVACVGEYIVKKDLKPQCVIIFTDGFVESDPKWDVEAPTLWLVTQNKHWVPPVGKVVMFDD